MTREEQDKVEFEEWFNSEEAREFRLMEKPDHRITWLASRRVLRGEMDRLEARIKELE